MENPAHVYTTGIPMSGKGNFPHNKYGCDGGSTRDVVVTQKSNDHNYPTDSSLILYDSSGEGVEYISNSIQDGFQSEILCSFVCDAGLQSDLPMDNASLDIDSISESGSHIKFSDSPEPSFTEKIGSFPSVEGLVPSLDEQLDNYLMPDFKTMNKSDDGVQILEEEQRTVTEAISAIAKSFGIDDLLPENFQVDGCKDGLSVTVASDSLCNEENEHIGELSLGDFEKCAELHSPQSSLDLTEQLSQDAESYVLNGLNMFANQSRSFENTNNRFPLLLKSEKFFLNSREDFGSKDELEPLMTDERENSENFDCSVVKVSEPENNRSCSLEFEQSDSNLQENKLCDVNENLDVPTVRISDVEADNLSEIRQNCSSAGTVLITRDKTSKKMQIVLTLDQGQQIYNIDTESVDANEESLSLDFQTSLNKVNLEENIPEPAGTHAIVLNEQNHVSADIESEKSNDPAEDAETSLEASNFMQLVSNIPITPPKGKKGKTWVCPVEDCGQILDKECKFRVHMISHKDARPFKCNFEGCDWAFTTPYRLRRHAETHLGSKDYVCDFEGCNRKFTTVYNLKTHKKRHKWPNSLTCPSKDCKMSFSNRRKLELHLRVHKDVEAPYKCSLCGKQYYSANCIASHYRTHQYNEDDFKCPFADCGKVYDKICRLRQHVRQHTGDRPYTCPAEGCKWSFVSASKLTRHMRKHTGERKFVCTEPGCGKSFMRPEHLKGHIVIHSGDKPFHCPHENCNARFTAKSSLYVHVKKHCPSLLKVVYPCPVLSCIKKYNSKATLKQHLQKFHPETVRDGKKLNIAEKLELTMPVSVVSPNNENSLGFLELDESVADDPSSSLKVELFQPSESSLCNLAPSVSFDGNLKPIIINTWTVKTDLKASKNSMQIESVCSPVESKELSKRVVKIRNTSRQSVRLMQKHRGGCARTDFYCSHSLVLKKDNEQSFDVMSINVSNNRDNQESKNYSISNQLNLDVKSPDVMFASTLFHEHSSEQFMKSTFSPDESSSTHSLYHDDSMLDGSSAFTTGLIPSALLSDDGDSDESVLTRDSSGVVFSEQNGVDEFSESIHLHGLD
ncbi:Zinc finger X-linked protein ZXDB, partial [Stegodyphus mimosarum]